MLVVRSHMARFSSYVTDTMFAPHMSEFTKAEVPDVLKEIDNHESWLSMFLLNSVLRSRYTGKTYQFAYNFLRRSEGVCREYELARKQTAIFLKGSRLSISLYSRAIQHWEYFLSHGWHSFLLLSSFAGHPRNAIFKKGDGSVDEKLNGLYSLSKHAESQIENGHIPDTHTIPIWLENDGLRSVRYNLSFGEARDIVMLMAQWANRIVDPLKLQEMLKNGEI